VVGRKSVVVQESLAVVQARLEVGLELVVDQVLVVGLGNVMVAALESVAGE